MSARDSPTNTTIANLTANASFFGQRDAVGEFTKVAVSVFCDQPLTLYVYQSINGSIIDKVDIYTTVAKTQPLPNTDFSPDRIELELTHKFVWLTARNGATPTTICRIQTQVFNAGYLKHEHDNVALWGETNTGTQKAVLTDTFGALIVSPKGDTLTGVNGDFQFYATPTTNIQAVYADGTKGTDVVGGWRYTNTATGKINWYCYASAGSPTDYKVSQLSNMYAVVNNLSTLGLAQAQNPFIIFYTRPTGAGDASWYKSKYFYGSNAFTDVNGVKLLYTGTDPVGVHPEITGNNRIQLEFKIAESTKTVEDGASESIWLGSLHTTNNTATVGSFNFDFQEFGVVWDKTQTLLPVEFGKLQIAGEVSALANRRIATQTATLTTLIAFTGSTFDLGENTVFDCLLLASGTIINGNVRIEYSVDGTAWIPDTAITLTTTDPHSVVKGVKTSSRYIRVAKSATSLFQGTLAIYISSSRL
jgi:hypothetical protein